MVPNADSLLKPMARREVEIRLPIVQSEAILSKARSQLSSSTSHSVDMQSNDLSCQTLFSIEESLVLLVSRRPIPQCLGLVFQLACARRLGYIAAPL